MHMNHSWRMAQEKSEPMSIWSREDDKIFEKALVEFPDGANYRWHNIANLLPGKSADDARLHYDLLLHDIREIDSDQIELPLYSDEVWEETLRPDSPGDISFESNRKRSDVERKKGKSWTPEEHRLFLEGLARYGKGDWRSISRNVVVTRTPTQVASHAQKYYLRQNSVKKSKKRSSIHDVTTTGIESIAAPVPSNLQSQGRTFENFSFSTAK